MKMAGSADHLADDIYMESLLQTRLDSDWVYSTIYTPRGWDKAKKALAGMFTTLEDSKQTRNKDVDGYDAKGTDWSVMQGNLEGG